MQVIWNCCDRVRIMFEGFQAGGGSKSRSVNDVDLVGIFQAGVGSEFIKIGYVDRVEIFRVDKSRLYNKNTST